MKNTYTFISGYRLNIVKKQEDDSINWLFLPGGPGMGSEYLCTLTSKLKNLPGNIILADFPGDGGNLNTEDLNINKWKSGLVEVLKSLKPCILVTHSFSGMMALTMPELERDNLISGLIIISSAPNKSWMNLLPYTAIKYGLPSLESDLIKLYTVQSDKQLEKFFHASIPYLFTEEEILTGSSLLKLCNYNVHTKLWADKNFHPTYTHSFVPNVLATIIIGSHDDNLLPIELFLEQAKWFRDNIKIIALKDTGHFPWLSRPDIINGALLEMVGSVHGKL